MTAPSPLALQVDRLRVVRAGRTIVGGVSMQVRPGSVTALLGVNGAGKTTIVRCCTGLWAADDGTVEVFGTDPAAAAARGWIGLMPQATGAWSGVRAGELVHYLASLYADPVEVEPLLAQLGIADVSRVAYRRLSGGQQQAVNLAGALVGRPPLLLLDEPTAGMDPHARRTTWKVIEEQRNNGVAVLLTTHAMDEAQALADTAVIIDRGQVQLSGAMTEITSTQSLEDIFLRHTQPATQQP